MKAKNTVWSELSYGHAASNRGWLKAITEPWKHEDHSRYDYNTTPIYDEDIKAWREQSTLGHYVDFGLSGSDELRSREFPHGAIYAVSYASQTCQYCRTVSDAKAWIESEVKRVRPELQIQGVL